MSNVPKIETMSQEWMLRIFGIALIALLFLPFAYKWGFQKYKERRISELLIGCTESYNDAFLFEYNQIFGDMTKWCSNKRQIPLSEECLTGYAAHWVNECLKYEIKQEFGEDKTNEN